MNSSRSLSWAGAVFIAVLLGLGLRGIGLSDSVVPRAATTNILAQEVTPTAQTSERVVILAGGDQSYPPYEFLNNGIPDGFNIDLAKSVAEVMGFDIEIRLGPWSEVRQDLLDGNLDVILGMANTVDRDKTYDFSVPYVYISFDLFVPANSSIRSLNDVRGLPVVVQSGGVMQEYLLQESITADVILVQDASDALRLVENGDYPAALLNRMQGQFLIQQLGLAGIKRVGIDLLPRKYSFAVVDGKKEILSRLNEGLYILNSTGQLAELQEKWFGVYESEGTWDRLQPWVLGLAGALGLLIVSLVLTWSLRRQVYLRTKDFKKSEEKYRLLVENATEGVVVSCGDVLVFANPAAAAITGYGLKELIGMRIIDLLHPDDAAMVLDRYTRRLRGEEVPAYYSFRLIHRTRETRWIQVHAVMIEWEGKPATLDMFFDITERRRAEDQVQQQLRHMAALRAVDMAITASMDLPLTLRVLLEQVTVQLGVDAASILLLEEETQELVYAAGQGFRNNIVKDQRIRMGRGYAGEAALKRGLVRITDMNLMPDEIWTPAKVNSEGFVTYIGLPLISKGTVKGVLEIFHRSALNGDPAWMNFLEAMGNQAAIAIDNAQLLKNLKTANLDLTLAYDATIAGWAHALELRDGDTEGHSQRVAEMAVDLAAAMGVHGEALVHIRRGAILHDIGKMAIPDSILKKKDNLTETEWAIMRMHPVYSYEMLTAIDFLRPALDIPFAHHEWWDGSGYPRGLREEQIPLAARIFAVVDVWDALINDRQYRKGWDEKKAMDHIRLLSGSQFDPRVVAAFCQMIEKCNDQVEKTDLPE